MLSGSIPDLGKCPNQKTHEICKYASEYAKQFILSLPFYPPPPYNMHNMHNIYNMHNMHNMHNMQNTHNMHNIHNKDNMPKCTLLTFPAI